MRLVQLYTYVGSAAVKLKRCIWRTGEEYLNHIIILEKKPMVMPEVLQFKLLTESLIAGFNSGVRMYTVACPITLYGQSKSIKCHI